MSHFAVLVIAADVAAALQPFHEFECTGKSDQYVQDVDLTAEARESYEADTTRMLIDPQGARHSKYDGLGAYKPQFLRAPTADEDAALTFSFERGKPVFFVPEGWQEIDVPTKEVESFSTWAAGYYGKKLVQAGAPIDVADQHKFGHILLNAAGEVDKVIDRTNPNKKWDWWQVGGRWHGKLKLKPGRTGSRGEPSLLMSAEQSREKPGYCDAALAGDVDWDGMLAEHATKAAQTFDAITACINGRQVQSWQQLYARVQAKELTIDAARDLYNGQPAVKDLIEQKVVDSFYGAETLSGVLAAKDRQSYIDRQSKESACTWAVLQDGYWHEKGSMGWWGMSDATRGSTLDYVENFWLTIRALAADAHVAVVDCHI